MWLYRGKELVESEIPEKAIGFIYMIIQKSTGKRYIGRKLLTSASSKMVNGKKKKIRKASDWKDYWSSSPQIQEWIAESGTDDFSKEILVFCSTKGSLAYLEEMSLYQVGALEKDNFLNQNIRSKIYRSWIAKDLDAASQLRSTLSSLL